MKKTSVFKITGIYIIGIIILTLSFAYLLAEVVTDVPELLKENKKRVVKYVGEKVIYDQDTCTIVDYSLINGTYLLDNDKEVSYEYAINNIVEND